MPEEKEIEELMQKYKQKLGEQLKIAPETFEKPVLSREYQQFKKEYLPARLSLYEKACAFSENLLKIKPDPKKGALLQESIDISHLNITPAGATAFSLLFPIMLILVGSLVSFAVFNSLFFVVLFLLGGLIIITPLANMPHLIANNWRMKASNQMVLCVFYVVTFMRHTSNLELAIDFAAEHLSPPLAIDLKKIMWDVETQKYESVKESLDAYLETWRKWNIEFIEAFHLIESSLYESSEDRRIELLDKSLDVILTETYEKMLHYAHNLQSPITMLHMLGVILPILGLVILPLVVSFVGGVQWYHLSVLYNVILPVGVYFLGKSILSKRPTGYGDTDISESNPEVKKYKNIIIKLGKSEIKINPLPVCIALGVILFSIGLIPPVMHMLGMQDIGFGELDPTNTACGYSSCLLGYKMSSATEPEDPMYGKIVGPFAFASSILSFFMTLAFGLSIGIYYKLRSSNVMQIRENTKKLENEFASAIFQLGSRLGDGMPAEIAFGKVADVMQETTSGSFFSLVSSNIRRLGMSVKDAIFNPDTGALLFFPSKLIESSMKVLMQSLKKGPKVAAMALLNISRYVKEIHQVNERLKDLMADIISSMKSQISFMAPVIAGIVIGITSMITTILGSLSQKLSSNELAGSLSGTAGTPAAGAGILGIFGDGIPTYYFQIIVGFYVVQIVYILTILSNGIENGADSLAERYSLGKNLIRSTILYTFVSMSVMILFNTIASVIITRSFS